MDRSANRSTPLSAAAADVAPRLRPKDAQAGLGDTFQPTEHRAHERSDNLAMVVIAALDRASIPARTRRDLTHLTRSASSLCFCSMWLRVPTLLEKLLIDEVVENVMLRKRDTGRFGCEASWRA